MNNIPILLFKLEISHFEISVLKGKLGRAQSPNTARNHVRYCQFAKHDKYSCYYCPANLKRQI